MNDQHPAALTVDRTEPRILIVEDETHFARAVSRRLDRAGYSTESCETLAAARAALDRQTPDMLLLDMRLPDGSGIDLLVEIRERRGLTLPVLIMTAYGELDDAVQAMKLNAMDYLKKPVDLDELLLNVEMLRLRGAEQQSLASARSRELARAEGPSWIGRGEASLEILSRIERIGAIAAASQGIPPTVMLAGETGTGKDLAAGLLHQARGDTARPFVQVDCAALPPHLIESELFGHEKGAFTSATQSRLGLFEAAENGTLFLDEIGELSLDLQAKLLAVLERRSLRRVGGNRQYPVAAWILVATNRDLRAQVADGGFRQDLYFRLQVLDLALPPLRERNEDIPALLDHFVTLTARRYGLDAPALPPPIREALQAYHWPGNVRELRHWVERAVLLNRGGRIRNADLPGEAAPMVSADELGDLTLEQAERMLIERALERFRGNVSRTARALGVTRMALRYRMDKHGIARPADD